MPTDTKQELERVTGESPRLSPVLDFLESLDFLDNVTLVAWLSRLEWSDHSDLIEKVKPKVSEGWAKIEFQRVSFSSHSLGCVWLRNAAVTANCSQHANCSRVAGESQGGLERSRRIREGASSLSRHTHGSLSMHATAFRSHEQHLHHHSTHVTMTHPCTKCSCVFARNPSVSWQTLV